MIPSPTRRAPDPAKQSAHCQRLVEDVFAHGIRHEQRHPFLKCSNPRCGFEMLGDRPRWCPACGLAGGCLHSPAVASLATMLAADVSATMGNVSGRKVRSREMIQQRLDEIGAKIPTLDEGMRLLKSETQPRQFAMLLCAIKLRFGSRFTSDKEDQDEDADRDY